MTAQLYPSPPKGERVARRASRGATGEGVYPHSPSPTRACYSRAMVDPYAHLPEMLRTAARRLPRRARKMGGKGGTPAFPQNNFIAEAPKNPIGARPGNRNAVTHGHHTVDSRARRAAIKSLCECATALSDAVAALQQMGMNASDHGALLALLADDHDG